jgi:putative transposase
MARPARLVIPEVSHHVVQRGNRKQALFFDDDDRRAYLELLGAACARHKTRCLAWCLMDNHVHLILVPAGEDGLRAPLASVHTAYSQRINRRQSLSGHLFQGRSRATRWARRIRWSPRAMSRTIRSRPGWRGGRTPGLGRAPARM